MTAVLPGTTSVSGTASTGLVSAAILVSSLLGPLPLAPTSTSLAPAIDSRTSWTSTTSAHATRRASVTAPGVAAPGVASQPSQADQVRDLHRMSGLTWTQLGSLFGVSRRAVHHWATGGRMNAANAELLAELTTRVAALGQTEPRSRRDALLTRPDAYEPSIVEEFRQRIAARETLTGTPLRPENLLDAEHDDRAILG